MEHDSPPGPNAESAVVATLRAELASILHSWEYAFAMGHGCSVGDHPRHRAVRERVTHLRARIAEHTT